MTRFFHHHFWITSILLLGACSFLESFEPIAQPPQFMGVLAFTQPDCENDTRCTLKDNFGYRDPFGVAWQAPAGITTDGASIPEYLWARVGQPFDADLLKAAVIHDFYCDTRVRSWQQTHRVFYDALLSSGVDKSRADLLYAGVLLGGPRWNDRGESTDFGYDPEALPLLPEETDEIIVETAENIAVVDVHQFVEETGFTEQEQDTQNNNQNILSEYDKMAELIAENPDLPPEAIANMASQLDQ